MLSVASLPCFWPFVFTLFIYVYTASEAEWNVFESRRYQNELHQVCKRSFSRIIDQFENGIISKTEINQRIINPIKSKLNLPDQPIYTFGRWVADTSKSESTDSAESAKSNDDEAVTTEPNDEQPASSAISMPITEIIPLRTFCIQSIHSNSNVTVMTAPYNAWICPNNQSFAIQQTEAAMNEKQEEKPAEDEEEEEEEEEEDTEEETVEPAFYELELFPIWKGFNIVQVYCCQDMINVLTDTGDVYCSVFSDLAGYQTEILFDKQITKITGCASNNKCVALSESGSVFEWSLVAESVASDAVENEQVSQKDENVENTKEEQKEQASNDKSVTFRISELIQWSQIDVKLRDVAITTSAYGGITEEKKLIIWGDFKYIYSNDDEEEDEKSKKKKNAKSKAKPKETEKEDVAALPVYLYVESKQEEDVEESEQIDLRYQQIVSCANSFIVLEEKGDLYSFGNDEYGALGLGREIKKCAQPKMIVFSKNTESDSKVSIRDMSSWAHGCIAADNHGDIWYWGKWFGSSQETESQDVSDETEMVLASPVKLGINGKCNRIKKCSMSNVGAFLWT